MASQINQNTISNQSTNKSMKFQFLRKAQDTITSKVIDFSLPGGTAEDNYIANFGGFSRIISFDFVCYDDGTDKSGDASNIITLDEQWDFLMDTIYQGGTIKSLVTHQISLYRNGVPKTYTGYISDLQIVEDNENETIFLTGTLSLIVGSN